MRPIGFLSLCLLGCAETSSVHSEQTLSGSRLLVLQTDYATGLYGEFYTDHLQFSTRQGPSGGDVVLGEGPHGPIILQRSQSDSLLLLDEDLQIQVEWPLDAGANAHDIQVVGDEIFIAAYGLNELLIFDLQGQKKATIPLSVYADIDGKPEAHKLYLEDEKLYLIIQNIDFSDGLQPQITDLSRLLVIDPEQREVTRVIEIPPNPFSDLVFDGGDGLLLACNGSWNEQDAGGIYRLRRDQIEAGEMLITKAAIGGDLTSPHGLAVYQDRIWLTVGHWQGGSELISFHRDGQDRQVHLRRDDWSLSCLYPHDGQLWLCDRKPGASGLRYSGDEFASLIKTRLPPTELLSLP
ncbi:MAG: hypothetical protein CMH55_07495 [Myxococcales bacterium]|nr:hypothetical protein [Myxococcales bacterium]